MKWNGKRMSTVGGRTRGCTVWNAALPSAHIWPDTVYPPGYHSAETIVKSSRELSVDVDATQNLCWAHPVLPRQASWNSRWQESSTYLTKPSEEGSVEKDVESINQYVAVLPNFPTQLTKGVHEIIAQDKGLQVVKHIILEDWQQLPGEVALYFSMREKSTLYQMRFSLKDTELASNPEALRLNINHTW